MTDKTPSELIDEKIASFPDWRGATLARLRRQIHEADPEIEETFKWRGVPVFEHGGIITTLETYRTVVKLTFAKGASLPDPNGLFNASLEGATRRAVDIPEGAEIDEAAFKALVRAGMELNLAKKKPARK